MRPLYFILALILIAGGIIFMLLSDSDPFGKENSKFSIDWSEEVQKISIREGNKTLVLHRSEKGWFLNNSQEVRESAISFILKTLGSLEIKSPLAEEKFKELTSDKGLVPTLVEVEGEGRKKISFLIYKSEHPGEPSIFLRKKGAKPFYLSVPAYDSDPGSHFVSNSLFWLPYHIFKLHPDKLKSVNLEYSDPDMDDLHISFEALEPQIEFNGVPGADVDIEKLKRYISYFTFVPFENWAFDMQSDLKEKILNSEPVMIFTIIMEDGASKKVKLWIRLIEGDFGVRPDTDRLYGEIDNGGDLFIVRYFDIDPLIKSSDYFIKD